MPLLHDVPLPLQDLLYVLGRNYHISWNLIKEADNQKKIMTFSLSIKLKPSKFTIGEVLINHVTFDEEPVSIAPMIGKGKFKPK